MKLTDDEKSSLLNLASSTSMKADMKILAKQRYNPLVVSGEIDIDRVLEFMSEFNEFINHEPKPFKPIVDKEMRL